MKTSATDWSPFYDQLHRYVASRVTASADVDDLVQAILERAITKSLTATIDSSVGWLFGIARNAIADHYRQQARSLGRAADALEAVADPLGDSDAERRAIVACMEPLLASIPPDAAELLRWADMQGESMQTISEKLGIGLSATKSRVQRARKEFVSTARACCTFTVDARSRVTDFSKRRGCAGACDCGSTKTS